MLRSFYFKPHIDIKVGGHTSGRTQEITNKSDNVVVITILFNLYSDNYKIMVE